MKNKMMKKIYSLVLLLVCITTLTGCLSTEARRKKVGERDKYELYLAHASQTDTVTDIFAMKFAELVEEKSAKRKYNLCCTNYSSSSTFCT